MNIVIYTVCGKQICKIVVNNLLLKHQSNSGAYFFIPFSLLFTIISKISIFAIVNDLYRPLKKY